MTIFYKKLQIENRWEVLTWLNEICAKIRLDLGLMLERGIIKSKIAKLLSNRIDKKDTFS